MHEVLSPASFTSLPSSLREKRKLGKVGLATSLQLSTTYLPLCHSRVDLVASEELARRAGPPLQVALAYRLELMKCGVCGPALLQKSQSSFSFIGKEGGAGGVELPCGTAFDFLYYPSSSQRRGHGGRAGIQNSTVLLPAASSKRLPLCLKLFFSNCAFCATSLRYSLRSPTLPGPPFSLSHIGIVVTSRRWQERSGKGNQSCSG